MNGVLDPFPRQLLIGILIPIQCLKEFAQVHLANGAIVMLELYQARVLFFRLLVERRKKVGCCAQSTN